MPRIGSFTPRYLDPACLHEREVAIEMPWSGESLRAWCGNSVGSGGYDGPHGYICTRTVGHTGPHLTVHFRAGCTEHDSLDSYVVMSRWINNPRR